MSAAFHSDHEQGHTSLVAVVCDRRSVAVVVLDRSVAAGLVVALVAPDTAGAVCPSCITGVVVVDIGSAVAVATVAVAVATCIVAVATCIVAEETGSVAAATARELYLNELSET